MNCIARRFRSLSDGAALCEGSDGGLRYRFSSSPTPSYMLNVAGYTLASLRAGYRGQRFEIFGLVRNAFDALYFDFLTAATGSTGFIVGQPGNPRT